MKTRYLFFVIKLVVGLEVKLFWEDCLDQFDQLRDLVDQIDVNWQETNCVFENLVGLFQYRLISELNLPYLKYRDLMIFWQTTGNTCTKKYSTFSSAIVS